VYANGFAGHQRGYFISSVVHWEWWLAGVHWWEYQMVGVFSWMRRVFSLNSVHGSRIRIFYGFYAKGQEFVRIRLE
jgi:hypothetical protein